MSARAELIAALVVAALVAFALYATTRIDLSFSAGMNLFTGPRGYPGVVLAAMLLLALVLVAQSVRRLHRAPVEVAGARSSDARLGQLKAAAAYVACGLFVLVFEPLGYILAMSALLVAIALLGGARRWPVALLACFVMMLACLLTFRYGLDTVLPEGILGIDMIF